MWTINDPQSRDGLLVRLGTAAIPSGASAADNNLGEMPDSCRPTLRQKTYTDASLLHC